jgi:hypothetical protein
MVALSAWGIQSWRDNPDAASQARTERRAETRTAPLAASAAPRRARQPSENEKLPVILQTDELPRAPEETDEDEEGTRSAESSPTAAKPEPKLDARSNARTDPGARVAAALGKPKAPSAPAATTPRRETPHRSAKQGSASADCNPPYFFDKNNIRRLKLECL